MNPGTFITLEGPDGSGKSTQLHLLAEALKARDYPVVKTRNPGGTPLGDQIRSVLLDSRTDSTVGGIAPEAELALMFADRAQCLQQIIRPALASGSVVLCDRFTDSSEAYQGAGRQLGPARILALHQAICNGQNPDLTFLLMPPLASSLARARRRNSRNLSSRGIDENRFESEGDVFYERIFHQYEAIALREPSRVIAIREDSPIELIAERILGSTLDFLALHRERKTPRDPASRDPGAAPLQ